MLGLSQLRKRIDGLIFLEQVRLWLSLVSLSQSEESRLCELTILEATLLPGVVWSGVESLHFKYETKRRLECIRSNVCKVFSDRR